MEEKIFSSEALDRFYSAYSLDDKKVVHAHGVFDLLHVGHITHLQAAKKLGDVLVVSITADRFVNKGPGRPAFTESLRACALAALECVDCVVINDQPTAENLIRELKPDIYVKGREFEELEDITGAVADEAKLVKELGGKIEFIGDVVFSSSNLINQFLGNFNAEQHRFLETIRAKYSLDQALDWLHKPQGDSVAVISEIILDEYLFTEPLGQSSKDPILAVQSKQLEVCPGGGLAIANHLAGFCKEVHLVSRVGEATADQESAKSTLCENVNANLLVREGTPTIRKRRLVDEYSGVKLLEVYEMNDRSDSEAERLALSEALMRAEEKAQNGLLLAADYGHGLIDHSIARHISEWKGYLALNAQCNAGNKGINSFKKYSRADYLCLAEKELQMEYRDAFHEEPKHLEALASELNSKHAMLTRGKKGTLMHSLGEEIYEAPALASQVVDRVGAGDSVLAISSLLLRHGAPVDIVSLVANAAGAIQVSNLGNRECLTRVKLCRFITSLLK